MCCSEVVSLLRELAAGLEDEQAAEGEDEDDEGSTGTTPGGSSRTDVLWRQAYLGSEQPPLTLGPVCVKEAAGARSAATGAADTRQRADDCSGGSSVMWPDGIAHACIIPAVQVRQPCYLHEWL